MDERFLIHAYPIINKFSFHSGWEQSELSMNSNDGVICMMKIKLHRLPIQINNPPHFQWTFCPEQLNKYNLWNIVCFIIINFIN